jgi:hypothetical protein
MIEGTFTCGAVLLFLGEHDAATRVSAFITCWTRHLDRRGLDTDASVGYLRTAPGVALG